MTAKLSGALALSLAAALALCACGGGSSNSGATAASASGASPGQAGSGSGVGAVVVRVGSAPITRAQVNHWMVLLAAQGYYELSDNQTEPEGLVSDPPRYGRCVQRLEAAIAASPAHKGAPPEGVGLLRKCRQLNQRVRAQAVSFLIGLQTVDALAAQQGVSASEAEVRKAYEVTTRQRGARQAAYKSARRATTADELVSARRDVLSEKVLEKLKASRAGLASVTDFEKQLKAKTDCSSGYVVEQCRQSTAPEEPNTPSTPSAAVLSEQIAALLTGRCVNRPACAKE